MDQLVDAVGTTTPPSYMQKITRVNTTAATSSVDAFNQIKANIARGLPRLHHLTEFKKVKGFDKPIALVGGGPSLKDNLDELRKYKTIMAAGSSHDFLRKSGINPTYAAICDSDKISSYYLTDPDTETKYLIASNCHAEVFDSLAKKQSQVVLWHCHSDDEYTNELIQIEKNYEGVGGGCTIGLRCLSIAIMLGYSNIHFFGYDSCLGISDAPYAYELDKRDNMLDLLGTIYNIQIGKEKPGSKMYRCLGYQVAQGQHFLDFYRRYKEYFKPTFHGGGMLSELYDVETSP